MRRILQVHGGPDPQHVTVARRRRAERLAEARIDELLALWRAGTNARGVADALGLQGTRAGP